MKRARTFPLPGMKRWRNGRLSYQGVSVDAAPHSSGGWMAIADGLALEDRIRPARPGEPIILRVYPSPKRALLACVLEVDRQHLNGRPKLAADHNPYE